MTTQSEKHELGRVGERVANNLLNGKTTAHKAPFDVVDFTIGYAYEVKAMSSMSKDFKIHISDHSMARKQAFANEYGLKMVLIAVVVHDPEHVDIYSGALRQSIRLNQMARIQ